MSICLSHMTADKILEHLAHTNTAVEPASSSVLLHCAASAQEARAWMHENYGAGLDHIDVLVSGEKNRRNNMQVICHRWKGLPPEGSLLRIAEGVYTVSPELCLLQQSEQLHFVNLCQMLGRYLATRSPYRDADGTTKLSRRRPLTSEEAIVDFLNRLDPRRKQRALRNALRWTSPGAASPQETNLQLALTLPYAYYGFRLKKPHMNEEIMLDSHPRSLCGKKGCYIDLYWPEHGFGLEYMGEEHNSTIGEDYARFYALRCQGIDLWYVAKDQMQSAAQIDYIAREVASRLGKEVGGYWPNAQEIQLLLDVLQGASPNLLGKAKRMRK